jgi:DNA repair protein RecN (Recombination protein N)
MLKHLTIKNYAIVSALELSLQPGFSVITGETGAGKSITFDALNYVLGSRADSRIVRSGAERCDIIAEFSLRADDPILSWLEQHELSDANQCLLKRTVYSDGRSRSFINGQPCPLTLTRQLARQLVHIHGQHENQNLLKRDGQRMLLDAFAQHTTLLQDVQQSYQAYQTTQQDIIRLTAAQQQTDRLAFIRYQLEELTALELDSVDLKKLELQHANLTHAEQIITHCEQVRQLLAAGEQACLTQLNTCQQLLSHLPESPALQEACDMLASTQINVTELERLIKAYAQHIELAPEQLQQLEAQLDKIYHCARKHRVKPEALLHTQHALNTELTELTTAESTLTHLLAQRDKQLKVYQCAAQQLTQSRQQAALRLRQQITRTLKKLAMPQCQFEIQLHACQEPTLHGQEAIEFFIQPNPGQAMQPLSKIASGGELARIALAIQVATASVSTVPTLLFDEIDVGVSGSTAAVIGKLLRGLSEQAQILCVTHQAQVASFAQHHYQVNKVTNADVVESTVLLLDAPQRVAELARILGGMEVTAVTLAHAEDLLTQASS